MNGYHRNSYFLNGVSEKARFWYWSRRDGLPDEKTIHRAEDPSLGRWPLYIWQAGITQSNKLYERSRSNTARRRQFAIELVTAGDAEVTSEDSHGIVKPGELFLIGIDRRTSWKTGPSGFLHKRFVCIDGPLLEPMLRATNLLDRMRVSPDSPLDLYRLMKRATRVLYAGSLEENLLLAYEMLTLIARYVRTSKYHPAVQRAIDFMNQHLDEKRYNAEIAHDARVSTSHLNHLFQKQFGISPANYFIRAKIARAKLLLATSTLTVKEVAQQLGYGDPYFFSRQFSQFSGVSPVAYRSLKGTSRR